MNRHSGLILKEGNIANYKGDAIVVPCWTALSSTGAICFAIEEKLEGLGYDRPDRTFWPENIDPFDFEKRVPLFSAHYFKVPSPFDRDPRVEIKGYILAACYVDNFEKPQDLSFSKKAGKTTKNALKVAGQNDVESIAFPTLMTGDQGGKLEDVVPAMVGKFEEHLKSGRNPNSITLYVYGKDAYDVARKLV